MKKTPIILFFLLTSLVSFSQKKELIEKLNKEYTTAVEQGDTVALKNIFHDDMVVTGAMGRQRDKKAEIADLVIPGLKIYFYKMENETTRVFNNTAITTGNLVWKMNMGGSDRDFKMVFTFTYAEIGKDWKIVAQHIGRAPM